MLGSDGLAGMTGAVTQACHRTVPGPAHLEPAKPAGFLRRGGLAQASLGQSSRPCGRGMIELSTESPAFFPTAYGDGLCSSPDSP